MQAYYRLALVEDLTIYHALEHKQRLMTALEEGEAIELDLSHVGEIDSAGLQLLILARREACRLGKAMAIVAAPAVLDTLQFCNLTAFFGDPVAAVGPNNHTED